MEYRLKIFKEHFYGYENNYCIIGGTACAIHDIEFRRTVDIDIVIIAQDNDMEFINKLKQFITAGGYRVGYNNQYYRFDKPTNDKFPKQIEIFAQTNFTIDNSHIIKLDNSYSYFSAILMDSDYINLLKNNMKVKGVTILSVECLIVFKIKAFLGNYELSIIDKKFVNQYNKHLQDVFYLVESLTPSTRLELPKNIMNDVNIFLSHIVVKDYKFSNKEALELIEVIFYSN